MDLIQGVCNDLAGFLGLAAHLSTIWVNEHRRSIKRAAPPARILKCRLVGVPELSKVNLFRSEVRRSFETELLIFPKVIRTDDELYQATKTIGERRRDLVGNGR